MSFVEQNCQPSTLFPEPQMEEEWRGFLGHLAAGNFEKARELIVLRGART